MSTCKDSDDLSSPPSPVLSKCAMTLALLWVALGMFAFIRSLYCFGRSGTTTQKILGLLISWVAGPLYFFFSPQGYCT